MCYGHWMQCSFMHGPPKFGGTKEPGQFERQIKDSLGTYSIPAKCDKPRKPDYVNIYSFEKPKPNATEEEIKFCKKKLELKQPGIIIGSADDIEGQILNRTALPQHAAILHNRGKLYLKPINGFTQLHSISLFNKEGEKEDDGKKKKKKKSDDESGSDDDDDESDKKKADTKDNKTSDIFTNFELSDLDGKKPRSYVNTKNATTVSLQGGLDKMKKLSREFCCFSLQDPKKGGSSGNTIYWVQSNLLPLGDDEYEEGGIAPTGERRRGDRDRDDRGGRGRDDRKDDRNGRANGRSRSRDRRRGDSRRKNKENRDRSRSRSRERRR